MLLVDMLVLKGSQNVFTLGSLCVKEKGAGGEARDLSFGEAVF